MPIGTMLRTLRDASGAASTHEELFIQRYALLLNMSLKVTGNDRERAEDLVHDAFVQFTVTRPDLAAILNLEGYLYAMLRNMHLSNVRRAVRRSTIPYVVLEYDSAELGLRATDSHLQVTARDQLRAICGYACARKETSRAGAVLILRFFHGYYPGEIAQVMRSPRRAVDDWLRIARREAKLFLEEPRKLDVIGDMSASGSCRVIEPGGTTADFVLSLQQAIFKSRRGACLSPAEVRALYGRPEGETVTTPVLAHIVSCPRCLEEVNRVLGLPPVSDRYPTDMLGPDTRNRNGHAECRRRSRQVVGHSPRELHIAANGFELGSQNISSEISEQSISINISERLGFIEVLSEQGVRMLFLPIEPAPDGPITQSADAELSEGRSLEVEVAFCDSWPRLRARYVDPSLGSLPQETARPASAEQKAERRSLFARLLAGLRSVAGSIRPNLTPVTVTAVMALLLIGVLIAHRISSRPPVATELLSRAVAMEEGTLWKSDVVVHRTVELEHRNADNRRLMSRRRIEIWSGPDNILRARRVYDERGELLAGEWSRDDSSSIYRRGSEPRVSSFVGDSRQLLAEEDIWRIEPTATAFVSLIRRAESVAVDERSDGYLIAHSQRDNGISGTPALVRATLLLARGDLRPVEQTLLVRDNGGLQEYRFLVSMVEDLSVRSAPATLFIPDASLTGAVPSRSNLATEPGAPPFRISPAGYAGVEVEALSRLHHAGSCLQEPTGLSRTADGSLRIHTIVESERRKAEVLDALGAVASSPRLRIEVDTVAEAQKREVGPIPTPRIPRRIAIVKGRIPVHSEVRAHLLETFGNGASDAVIDEEIARFARRVMDRSRRALLHAGALVRHLEQFSLVDRSGLGAGELEKRHAVIAEHSAALEQEIRALRAALQPIFLGQAFREGGGGSDFNGLDEAQLVRRLFEIATAQEKAVRLAFALSPEDEGLLIRTREFWVLLLDCETLATRLRSFR